MSLQRYDLIAPNGFYIIGNGVCRLTALHPLQGAFTHVMCVMKCNRKCKVWAESAFCILGRINPALRTREHANMRTCEHGVFAHVRVFACSRRIPPSPLEAVLNRRILACSGKRTTDSPRARTARRQAIRKKNLALRPSCTIFGSALYRRRLGKLQTSLHLRPSCTIFVFIL